MTQNFDKNLKLVFDMYDFDGDGLIAREDIRTLLSSVPLAPENGHPEERDRSKLSSAQDQYIEAHYDCSEQYFARVQSQVELEGLLDLCLGSKEKIDFSEFVRITEKVSSEMFLCVTSPLTLRRYSS